MLKIRAKLSDFWRQITWRDVRRGVLWFVAATGFVPLLAGALFLWLEPQHWQNLPAFIGFMWLMCVAAAAAVGILFAPLVFLAYWFKLSESGTSLLISPLAIAQLSGAVRDTRGTWFFWCVWIVVVAIDMWQLIRRQNPS